MKGAARELNAITQREAVLNDKQFLRPDGDRGAVYIYRSGLFGLARPLDVGIANGINARLPYNSYLRVDGPSGSCADPAIGPVIDAARSALRGAGLTRLRCLAQSGAVVFERDL